jgi:hypothetical protein
MGLTEDSPASLTPPLGDPIIDEPDPDLADLLGIKDPIFITFPDVPNPPPPPYIIIDDITFQCTGLGDAIIWLFDGEGNFLDSQTIHQTPEPATLALLGLGALLLRRKSKI